jgi:2-phospho-L-lactate guanylyltransferase
MVEEEPSEPRRTHLAVLVPVKAFSRAKLRLAEVLDPGARDELAREMAATVVHAAGDLPTAVVCDDDDVRTWAAALDVEVVWTPGLGLNGAVEAGVAHLAGRGARQVIVAHADLPLATDLAWVGRFGGVTLVPDRHRDGTNVASVPAMVGYRFAYGGGSFTRHRAEAARLGLPLRIVPDEALGWDVDVPADLTLPNPPAPEPPVEVPCR